MPGLESSVPLAIEPDSAALMLDFSRFEILTFDCYGTLIDWETGILSVLHRLLSAHGKEIDRLGSPGTLWRIRAAFRTKFVPAVS